MGDSLRFHRLARVICTILAMLVTAGFGWSLQPSALPPVEGTSPSAPAAPLSSVPSSGGNDASASAANLPSTGSAQDARLGPGQQAISGSAPTGSPGYKLLRYDEDWSFLVDPDKRSNFWDPLKYIPLGIREGDYLTIGGDFREWFESYHNGTFGLAPGNAQGNNTYFLQRYMLYCDLHLGPDFRIFIQTLDGFEDGRIGGPRPDIDSDQFGFHQLFFDWKWEINETDSLTWRLGRQEFEYGSGRLIDVREGPNLRLSFDAARFLARSDGWSIDGWWGRPVENNLYTFDDVPDPNVSFWGLYVVRPLGDGSKLNFDLYYLGFENRQASFDQRSGYELRHSLGVRIWGQPKPIEYNCEYVYQFGTFDGGRISAWTAANAARYTLEDLTCTPRLGLHFDVASGNRDAASPNLQTFNPLFPSGAYFNLTGPFGPMNLIDLHPTLDLTLSEKLTLTFDWNFFWRQSLNDGVYQLSGNLLASGLTSRARYIGSSPATTLIWNATRNFTVLTSYVHIFPGEFLQEATPGKPVDYATMWLSYRF